MKTQIKKEGEWIFGTPSINEWYREEVGTFSNGDIAWLEKRNVVLEPEPELIQITITDINGPNTKRVNSDFTSASCYELKDIHISGTVNVPDRIVEMTVSRDDGRLFFFEGEIKNGLFNVIFNFPTVGRFTYSDFEANFRIGKPTFRIKTLNLTVMRNPLVPET